MSQASSVVQELSRRGFLGWASAGAIAAVAGKGIGAIAGPFGAADLADDFPIPADKKLSPEWLRSLFARTTPEVFTSARGELRHIGMPIGGICCGQVYLAGDGRLWHWDIFNLPQAREWSDTSGPLYARPAFAVSPIEQGFALRVSDAQGKPLAQRMLDSSGFRDIEFRGEYPVATIKYADDSIPVRAELEAFSPFIPLNVDDSSLPCILMRWTLRNESDQPLKIEIGGWLQNAACLSSGVAGQGSRVNTARTANGWTTLDMSANAAAAAPVSPKREDIIVEDWEKGTYEGWTVSGKAFGEKPRNLADIATYQGNVNAQGKWTVNSHETRSGEDVGKADTYLGTLTSAPFKVQRDHLSFRIGGGNHPGQTCVNLLADGAVVRSTTGRNDNRMRTESWDVREFAGREVQIQIVDGWSGAWGQVGCDEITQTDGPRGESTDLASQPDFGTMAISVLGPGAFALASLPPKPDGSALFALPRSDRADAAFPAPLVGAVGRTLDLGPGKSETITFAIAWHFPTPNRAQLGFLRDIQTLKRHYARFAGAGAVCDHVAANLDRFVNTTRAWRDTWNNSSLPHWFLDRTFVNVSTAATSTCYLFDSGRFYGWEGTHCCAGTCTHVWQYAQSLARVFPSLERSLREGVDFGIEFNDQTGLIHYRGEASRELAIDGQCGTIIRAWREHTMSPDSSFLQKVYPRVRKALELVIARDTDQDGILDGAQYNTLDTTWYGQISWITSLYLCALRAGEAMARETGDQEFAGRCADLASKGLKNLPEKLFNGEYFVHKTDPAHPEANSTGQGCHSDQMLGQCFAHQAGLPRILPSQQCATALRSIYTYCFALDAGAYRRYAERTVFGGRWYAMPGEGGLLLCTWPHGGSEVAMGKSGDAWAAGYFNECWTGFESQVASHMIWESLTTEGMAITRMLHDRHHASRRNPYNEIECSNHYARAMSSHGSFIAACGFRYHGPSGEIEFAPRIFVGGEQGRPPKRDFKAAFIAAQGWGT